MIDPEQFQFRCEAMTLWRDGNQAVVSAKIGGRWVRLVAADCRGIFNVEVPGPRLREVSRDDYMTARRRRHNLHLARLAALKMEPVK